MRGTGIRIRAKNTGYGLKVVRKNEEPREGVGMNKQIGEMLQSERLILTKADSELGGVSCLGFGGRLGA